MKPVKAWAVLTKQEGTGYECLAWKDFARYRYPIFPTRKTAKEWINGEDPGYFRIVRVVISEARGE